MKGKHLKKGALNDNLCKGKAVPLQAWCGPEGSRKFRFPDYMTTAQDGGNVVSINTGRLYLLTPWCRVLLEKLTGCS
jgi:hypothetical protein